MSDMYSYKTTYVATMVRASIEIYKKCFSTLPSVTKFAKAVLCKCG